MTRHKIVYVTASSFKVKENAAFVEHCSLSDGTKVSDAFEFQIRQENIIETLEVDLEAMVHAEVTAAYGQTRVPCIVEHAGLLFEGHPHYPGGLTKPMWNALRDRFVSETQMAGKRATARAVVGYCDGMTVRTFTGDTQGTLVDPPRGARDFYWDRVFVPEDPTGRTTGKTYAEIVEDPTLGLAHKMVSFSQSARAMVKFLEYRRANGPSDLWR
jgi:inosine/xanthosine triphosphate pyrophosphatase family protein